MPVEVAALPLEEIVARAERLVALSPADQTQVLWSEGRLATVLEGARVRRVESGRPNSVRVRVRAYGRTGVGRSESAEVGELQQALRAALADALCREASPDWEYPATVGDTPPLEGLYDPELAALEPADAQEMLRGLASRNATLRLRWSERRLAVVSSFHPPRAAALTTVSLAARTGRRPGSGFAAATARGLRSLAAAEVIERARALEAEAVDRTDAESPAQVVLAPEATAVLIDAFARRVLSGGSRLRRRAESEAVNPWPIAEALTLVDEPLRRSGAPLPFDLDGMPKRRRIFVEAGRPRGAAFDLELAAAAGEHPTGHGLGGDDAWPTHLEVIAGDETEEELRRRSDGGLRIGSLEDLALDPTSSLELRATARSLRRIGPAGALGVALPPMTWTAQLADVLARVSGVGREGVAWMPRDSDLGAVRAVPLRLERCGSFALRRGDL